MMALITANIELIFIVSSYFLLKSKSFKFAAPFICVAIFVALAMVALVMIKLGILYSKQNH